LDKPIEIKRRAQRFVQSGDLDGALAEYQKLARAEPGEPYHVVVIADLRFRKGDQSEAAKLYLEAVDGYQQSTLYKNAIAVCKKMVRLGLAPSSVFRRLGELHVHDGLRTEAGLYFMQHGEMSARREDFAEAEKAYRQAFESSPENVVALERLADLLLTRDDTDRWRQTIEEAAVAYDKLGQINEATRCRSRISGGSSDSASKNGARHAAPEAVAPAPVVQEPPAAVEEAVAAGETEIDTFTDPAAALREAEAAAAPEGFERTSMGAPARAEASPEQPGLQSAPGPVVEDDDLVLETNATEPENPPAPVAEPVARRAAAPPPPEPAVVAATPPAPEPIVSAAEASAAAPVPIQPAPRPLSDSGGRTRDALIRLIENCRQRKDQAGAAATACEIGDLALMEGDRVGAIEWFERALEYDPGCQQAKDLIHRLASAKSTEISEVPMYDLPVLDDGTSGKSGAEGVQSVSSIADEGRVDVVLKGERFDLGSLVSSFQEQIKDQFEGDPRGHFDLGMTYREMGMYDQAMESFRLAGESPDFVEAATEMMGRCLMDQGLFDEAAETLKHGAEVVDEAGTGGVSLRYHLGLAYEAGARLKEALAEFETVYKKNPGHADVANRIRALLKTLGTG